MQTLLKYYFKDKTPNQFRMNHNQLLQLVKDIITDQDTNVGDKGGDVHTNEDRLQEEEEEENREDALQEEEEVDIEN